MKSTLKKLVFTFIISLLIRGNLFAGSDIFYQHPDTENEKMEVSEVRKLLLKSMILPGWGEHSLDYHKRGNIFNTSEIIIWVAHFFFQLRGDALYSNMESYASIHAGVDPSGKDKYFYTDIGTYMNIYEYNEQKLRYRQDELLYPETDKYFWFWNDNKTRQTFDELRIDSEWAYKYASFAVTAMVVSRIVSVIDIFVLTRDKIETPDHELMTTILPTVDGVSFQLKLSL
jgi:hypothetical protein